MFCSTCGKEMVEKDGGFYCEACGQTVHSASESKKAEAPGKSESELREELLNLRVALLEKELKEKKKKPNKTKAFLAKYKKPIVIISLLVIIAIVVTVLCVTYLGGINGTYYKLKDDGTMDREDWIRIKGKQWSDSDGQSGKLEKTKNTITITVDGVSMSGTVDKDDVLTFTFLGLPVGSYKKDVTTSNGHISLKTVILLMIIIALAVILIVHFSFKGVDGKKKKKKSSEGDAVNGEIPSSDDDGPEEGLK